MLKEMDVVVAQLVDRSLQLQVSAVQIQSSAKKLHWKAKNKEKSDREWTFFTKKIMLIELISATGKQSFEKLDF